MEIKMKVSDTLDVIEKWIQENNFEYDSIKLQCHSIDNSSSGVVFTCYAREKKYLTSESALNLADVSSMLPLLQEWLDYADGMVLSAPIEETERYVAAITA
jgi:hypothetical protein